MYMYVCIYIYVYVYIWHDRRLFFYVCMICHWCKTIHIQTCMHEYVMHACMLINTIRMHAYVWVTVFAEWRFHGRWRLAVRMPAASKQLCVRPSLDRLKVRLKRNPYICVCIVECIPEAWIMGEQLELCFDKNTCACVCILLSTTTFGVMILPACLLCVCVCVCVCACVCMCVRVRKIAKQQSIYNIYIYIYIYIYLYIYIYYMTAKQQREWI